jgi:hypothetical protein
MENSGDGPAQLAFIRLHKGPSLTGEAARMWGRLQFIRFVRVAMFEIERRADVSPRF